MAEARRTPAQLEVAVSLDQPMTLADLREFLGQCDHAGIPDTAVPLVRIAFGGKIKRIAVRGDAARKGRARDA